MVLVIPVILAILGDNPMQSEIACHIGLTGKFFCRNCMVYGQEVIEERAGAGRASREHVRAESVASNSSAASDDSAKKKGKRKETMQDLVDRARRFLGVSTVLL